MPLVLFCFDSGLLCVLAVLLYLAPVCTAASATFVGLTLLGVTNAVAEYVQAALAQAPSFADIKAAFSCVVHRLHPVVRTVYEHWDAACLRVQLEKVRLELQSNKEQLVRCQRELSIRKGPYISTGRVLERAVFEGEIAMLKKKIDEILQSHQCLVAEYAKEKTRLLQAHEKELSDLKEELKQCKNRCVSLQAMLDQSRETSRAMQNRMNDLEKRLHPLYAGRPVY